MSPSQLTHSRGHPLSQFPFLSWLFGMFDIWWGPTRQRDKAQSKFSQKKNWRKNLTSCVMSNSCFAFSYNVSNSSHFVWRLCFSSNKLKPYWADWMFSLSRMSNSRLKSNLFIVSIKYLHRKIFYTSTQWNEWWRRNFIYLSRSTSARNCSPSVAIFIKNI